MRQGKNAKGYAPKPWTVVATQVKGRVGLATRYFARNLTTGEEGAYRATYVEALRDIPPGQQREGVYAEPWGV